MPNIENISLAPQMCSLSISKFLSSSGFVMSRATDPHLPCCERLQSVSSPFHSEIGSSDTGIHLLWLLKKKKITSKSKNVVTKAEACCQRMIVYVCAAGRSCALLCYATSDRWSLDVIQWVVKHLGNCLQPRWEPDGWLFGVLILFANTLSAGTSDKAQSQTGQQDSGYSQRSLWYAIVQCVFSVATSSLLCWTSTN